MATQTCGLSKWFFLLATLVVGLSFVAYEYKTHIVATYIHHKYNQTEEYGHYMSLFNNHTFRYCTTYVYKDSNAFHTWAEFDCSVDGYFKTHVYGDRKSEAQIVTSKEMGLTMGGYETITGIFPIDIFNQTKFGKYKLLSNNCRTYLVILHKILEEFPHHNKRYDREPVTELLNVNIGVDYSGVMSELTFQKIRLAITNLF